MCLSDIHPYTPHTCGRRESAHHTRVVGGRERTCLSELGSVLGAEREHDEGVVLLRRGRVAHLLGGLGSWGVGVRVE